MEGISEQLGAYGPLVVSAIKALLFLVVGWIVAGALSAFVRRSVTRNSRIDDTLGVFFASIVKWLVLIAVVIAVLQLFGFEATSLVAVLGAATLAVGFALQGTLADLAAGVMLVIFRPYRLNQYVDIGGTAGTVKDVNLFTTELVTPDNVQIVMPNGKAWGSVITNYSAHPTRRLDLGFGIDYGDDADKAMSVITDLATGDKRVHKDPAPWVRVVNLGESSVDLGVRLWCDAGDYWDLKFDMTKQVKEAFDKNGISIPYPHSVEIQKTA
ncbi:mechanosensitive ion channel [Kaustia mangrovi]|uniref:Small-conductance mechanosensitive channel n=1 Tax=Kaustia mangrovi TaxID=2593653 RepID=A0A7S8HAU1_9HYPH|nr:mechanosensitive ion channel domain-containing protein [Kaustia mangrovi]QPC41940.1 mechanosensitive ion channel [Kaustia mangrovi]